MNGTPLCDGQKKFPREKTLISNASPHCYGKNPTPKVGRSKPKRIMVKRARMERVSLDEELRVPAVYRGLDELSVSSASSVESAQAEASAQSKLRVVLDAYDPSGCFVAKERVAAECLLKMLTHGLPREKGAQNCVDKIVGTLRGYRETSLMRAKVMKGERAVDARQRKKLKRREEYLSLSDSEDEDMEWETPDPCNVLSAKERNKYMVACMTRDKYTRRVAVEAKYGDPKCLKRIERHLVTAQKRVTKYKYIMHNRTIKTKQNT